VLLLDRDPRQLAAGEFQGIVAGPSRAQGQRTRSCRQCTREILLAEFLKPLEVSQYRGGTLA
jgi:hypothetical protein